MIKLLYIGSSPDSHTSLNLDAEYERIKKNCLGKKNQVELKGIFNPSLKELQGTINTFQPDIIHFGGHGSENGELVIWSDETGEGKFINDREFTQLTKSLHSDNLRLLFLSSCYSRSFAERLHKEQLVDCIVAFTEEIKDDGVPQVVDLFYSGLLNGYRLEEDVIKVLKINRELNITSLWRKSIQKSSYRLLDPTVEELAEGQYVEGKKLLKKLQDDDIGSIWEVDGEDAEKMYVRRFLRSKIIKTEQITKIKLDFANSNEALKNEQGVLKATHDNLHDVKSEYTYIDYVSTDKLYWKPLDKFINELHQGELQEDQVNEMNSIAIQLAKVIDKIHHINQRGGLIHGRLNLNSILVVRPVLTDFPLYPLSARYLSPIKNNSKTISPHVKSGKPPRKKDDFFSLVSIWFHMLTGEEPQTKEFTKSIHSWYPKIKDFFDYDIVDFFCSVLDEQKSNAPQIDPSPNELVNLITDKYISKQKIEELNKYSSEIEVKELTNSFDMKFSYVSSDSYNFGSERGEEGSSNDEYPRRLIYLSGYYIGQCVLTIENVLKIVERSGDQNLQFLTRALRDIEDKQLPFTTISQDGAKRKISWQLAERLCELLTNSEEERKLGYKYYLPSEAQWEVACRAGTNTRFNTGFNDLNIDYANFKHQGVGGETILPVKSYPPNQWKLYEMHGNVWEFCQDYYSTQYPINDDTDPKGFQPKTSKWAKLIGKRYKKVIRGGDWNSPAKDCRSANRESIEDKESGLGELHEPNQDKVVGIRLICITLDMNTNKRR